MSLTPERDMPEHADVFAVRNRQHDPHAAPFVVRQAWANYLGAQATAELRFVRAVEGMRQVVAEQEKLERKIYQHTHDRAFDAYLKACDEADVPMPHRTGTVR